MVEKRKKLNRDEFSILFNKEVEHLGETYLQPWRKYYFSVPINHGLARTSNCLPADVPVVIRFHRAPANFSIMKMTEKLEYSKKSDTAVKVAVDFTFPDNVVKITNPILHAYYAYSTKLEQTMSKIRLYNFELPFMDYVARRTVLDSGLSEYDLNLIQGKMPKYLMFGLSSLDRISGSDVLSLTRFIQDDLIYFDLILGKLI